MDSKPRICYVCSRLCYLRCFDCDTAYCSMKCKLDDWDDHEIRNKDKKKPLKADYKKSMAFKIMEKCFSEHVKEGGHVSVQNRLKKTPVATTQKSMAPISKEPFELALRFYDFEDREEMPTSATQDKREFKGLSWSSDEEDL